MSETDDTYLREVTIGEPQELTGLIDVVDYDPQWPVIFARLAADIKGALGDTAVDVRHIGSTSVPGLPAKPIIDIDLIVPDSADEDAYVPALEKLGYLLRIREPDWFEHRVLKREDPTVNLHVFGPDAEPPVRNLAFRDWLRRNADDRDLYGATKRELAQRKWKYVQHYADAKTDIVTSILARAGYTG